MRYSTFAPNYDKFPVIDVPGTDGRCVQGWEEVCARIVDEVGRLGTLKTIVAVECYTGKSPFGQFHLANEDWFALATYYDW